MEFNMRRVAQRLASLLALFGFDATKFVGSVRGLWPYFRNRATFKRQMAAAQATAGHFAMGRSYPSLSDRYDEAGTAQGHYFHQDLYVAQLIFRNKPHRHVDVGSRVDGFVAHVASFRKIEVLDIRPLQGAVENILFHCRDITEERTDLDGYTDSLSCLHALEHFGLGRYGDAVDYDGYQKGWDNLYRMLTTGGKFYFSTPIGPQRIEFDAHRVFSVSTLVKMMHGKYRIDGFAYVDDAGSLVRDANPTGEEAQESFGCDYGCGIFELTKL